MLAATEKKRFNFRKKPNPYIQFIAMFQGGREDPIYKMLAAILGVQTRDSITSTNRNSQGYIG